MSITGRKEQLVLLEREPGAVETERPKQRKTDGKYIALFGLFGMGNYGNDGTLEAMVRILRRVAPEEKLFCICTVPDVVKQSLGIDGTVIAHGYRPSESSRTVTRLKKASGKLMLLFHAFWQLRKVKLFIAPGGGPLDDFCAHPLSRPFDYMVWTVMARLMGIEVVFVSIGAGPMRNPLSRVFLKLVGRAAHHRSYREHASKAFMADIGYDVSRDPVYPDLAFELPAPPDATTGELPLTVGVGVMIYRGWQQGPERVAGLVGTYVRKMTAYVNWLLDQGHRVRIVIGDESDKRAAQAILEAVRETDPDRFANSVVYEPAETLGDIMQQMATIDMAVASRFHNVVCALKMGKPTISISYAPKNDLLLAEMGLAEYCHQIEAFDVERLKMQTEQMLSQRVVIGRRIRKTCVRFEEEIYELERMLGGLLYGDRGSSAQSELSRSHR